MLLCVLLNMLPLAVSSDIDCCESKYANAVEQMALTIMQRF
jgi:hypothetical protein